MSLEHTAQPEERIDVTTSGYVLIDLRAEVAGSWGNVVIDIRRQDGSGGSLRAQRASVSFDAHIKHAAITMPVEAGERVNIYLEEYNQSAAPLFSQRTVYFP